MNIGEFRQYIMDMAQARLGLEAYSSFLKHATREDKYFREEHLAILAVVDYRTIAASELIELGKEEEPWDARIGGKDLFEVVQALPEKEHEIRLEIALSGASLSTFLRNACDHLMFPTAIINAIELKHKKQYQDIRSLIVVFSGDYSCENDEVISEWVQEIRNRTTLGKFKEILLVELARRKVFPLFPVNYENGPS